MAATVLSVNACNEVCRVFDLNCGVAQGKKTGRALRIDRECAALLYRSGHWPPDRRPLSSPGGNVRGTCRCYCGRSLFSLSLYGHRCSANDDAGDVAAPATSTATTGGYWRFFDPLRQLGNQIGHVPFSLLCARVLPHHYGAIRTCSLVQPIRTISVRTSMCVRTRM